MHKKEIEVRFSEEVDSEYKILQKIVLKEMEKGINNSFNMQLLRAIERTIQNLKIDPHLEFMDHKDYNKKFSYK